MIKVLCFIAGGILGFLNALCLAPSFVTALSNWLFTGDFLKVGISTGLGIIATGFFSIWKSRTDNSAALARQEKELDFKKIQWARDECKKYCLDYLSEMAPDKITMDLFFRQDINRLLTAIQIFADKQYSSNAVQLKVFATKNHIAEHRDALLSNSAADKEYSKKIYEQYTQEYGILIGLTSYIFGVLQPDDIEQKPSPSITDAT